MLGIHIKRIPIAGKDALIAPAIKLYMHQDGMHIGKEEMKKRLETLKGSQEPYRLDREGIEGKVTSYKAGDFYCYTFHPEKKKADKHIIYFCGGAFFQEATKYHLRFLESLSKKLSPFQDI